MRGGKQSCGEEKQSCEDSESVAGEVGVIGDVLSVSGDYVVNDNHLQGYEVYGGDIPCSDDVEPVYDGDEGLWEQDKICTGDGGDGTACAYYGCLAYERVSNAAKDGSCEIEAKVAEGAELVVYIVAEDIQEEHIAEDVQQAAVEKGVCYELPEMWPSGGEHKVFEPLLSSSNGFGIVAFLGPGGYDKYYDVEGYESVVGV